MLEFSSLGLLQWHRPLSSWERDSLITYYCPIEDYTYMSKISMMLCVDKLCTWKKKICPKIYLFVNLVVFFKSMVCSWRLEHLNLRRPSVNDHTDFIASESSAVW